MEKFERLVDEYNLGTLDVEAFFEALKKLVLEMDDEERRAAREGLTEDELAIFDLLTKPEPKLTEAEEAEVKRVARELLEKLQGQLRVDHWYGHRQPLPLVDPSGLVRAAAGLQPAAARLFLEASWSRRVCTSPFRGAPADAAPTRVLQSSYQPVRDASGEVVGVSVAIVDVRGRADFA